MENIGLVIIKMIKNPETGKLDYKFKRDAELVKKSVGTLRTGQTIDVYFDFERDDGRLGQIARVHSLIRDIATESDQSASDVKKIIKERACLYTLEEELKSFAKCSAKELDLAIAECEKLADFVGIKKKKN